MKNKKVVIIIVVVALIGLGIFMFARSKAKQDKNAPTGDNASTPTSPFPLKYGSKGTEVTQLEKYLIKEWGAKVSATGVVDDTWGPYVQDAVKKFLSTDQVTKELYDAKKMGNY
jgi:hypothetical protein